MGQSPTIGGMDHWNLEACLFQPRQNLCKTPQLNCGPIRIILDRRKMSKNTLNLNICQSRCALDQPKRIIMRNPEPPHPGVHFDMNLGSPTQKHRSSRVGPGLSQR